MSDPSAVTYADHTRKCNNCRHLLSADLFVKAKGGFAINCKPCREKIVGYSTKYNKSSKGKVVRQRMFKTESYKAKKRETNQCPQTVASQRKHAKTAKRKVSVAKYLGSDKHQNTRSVYIKTNTYKEIRRKEYAALVADPGRRLELAIAAKVRKMVRGTRIASATVSGIADFDSSSDIRLYFESQFASWMSWSNYGAHEVGGPRRWNIGHKIARFHFDAHNPEDVRRCWSKTNLFPQESKENTSMQVKFPSDLNALRPIWPTDWKAVPPSAADLTSMERAAVRGPGVPGASAM